MASKTKDELLEDSQNLLEEVRIALELKGTYTVLRKAVARMDHVAIRQFSEFLTEIKNQIVPDEGGR